MTTTGNANRTLALRLLRKHHQLSRREIAERAGVSEASASRVVSNLLSDGLATEVGAAQSTGGRRAARLQLNENHHYTVGVDIHPWETRVAIGVLSGRLVEWSSFPNSNGPMSILAAIVKHVQALVAKRPEMNLAGIGISARGLVDSRDGVIEHGMNGEWIRIPVREYIEDKLGAATYVENNVRATAFAEYHYGTPDVQDAHCLLLVTVDEGVGFGMVINGGLYYGQHMAAGEFGQMVIADAGGRETHDRPGSLESLAADGASCERYFSLKGESKQSSESATSCVRMIAHRALAGDKEAAAVLRQTARYLGIGISNVIWGLDPDAVVVDGTIADAWPVIAPTILDQFPDGREFSNFRNMILRPSALRGEAAMIGAAALPFQSLFTDGGPARR